MPVEHQPLDGAHRYELTTRSPTFISTCEHQAVPDPFALCSALRDASRSLALDVVDFASEEAKKNREDTAGWPVRNGSFPVA
jgi:hypothetical protein